MRERTLLAWQLRFLRRTWCLLTRSRDIRSITSTRRSGISSRKERCSAWPFFRSGWLFRIIIHGPEANCTISFFPRTQILLAPFGGGAFPAVLAQLRVERRRQGALVAGGEIGFDVAEFAHAGNDGADVGIVEDEAQGHFRHGHSGGDERFEGIGVGDT